MTPRDRAAYETGVTIAEGELVMAMAGKTPGIAGDMARGMIAESAAALVELEGAEALRFFLAEVLIRAANGIAAKKGVRP